MGESTTHDTSRVERESHVDSLLVSEPRHELSSDGREDDTSAKVGDLRGLVGSDRRKEMTRAANLDHGGLELGDGEEDLEVLVENIDETVRESPKEEERGDETAKCEIG